MTDSTETAAPTTTEPELWSQTYEESMLAEAAAAVRQWEKYATPEALETKREFDEDPEPFLAELLEYAAERHLELSSDEALDEGYDEWLEVVTNPADHDMDYDVVQEYEELGLPYEGRFWFDGEFNTWNARIPYHPSGDVQYGGVEAFGGRTPEELYRELVAEAARGAEYLAALDKAVAQRAKDRAAT